MNPVNPSMAMWYDPSDGESGGWNVRFVSDHTWDAGCVRKEATVNANASSHKPSAASSSHDDPEGLHPRLPFPSPTPTSLCCSYFTSPYFTVFPRTQPRRLVYRVPERFSSHRCQVQQRQSNLEIGRESRQAGEATAWAPARLRRAQGASEVLECG